MTNLRRLRYWSLLPVLTWIVAQLVMSAGLAHSPASASTTIDGLDTVIICTPQGPVVVSSASLAAGDEEDDGQPLSASAECHWCQAFSLGITPARTGSSAPLRFAGAPVVVAVEAFDLSPLHKAADGFSSRAPPC
ncbi:MAG: DUF2946 family protein [Pseudomonadota bacterium]